VLPGGATLGTKSARDQEVRRDAKTGDGCDRAPGTFAGRRARRSGSTLEADVEVVTGVRETGSGQIGIRRTDPVRCR
jgi:hypothetical protein